MARDRRGEGWGASWETRGPAGGKHTRGNKGQKPGCLDAIIVGLAAPVGVVYAVTEVVL